MEEEVGMMAPPEDMMMEEETMGDSPLSPEETQEVQSLVDSSPALAKFIDAIASVNPMDWGISTTGATEEPMAPQQPPMM